MPSTGAWRPEPPRTAATHWRCFVLARPTLTLDELLNLKNGDVIPVTIDRQLPLIVGNRVIAQGSIGEQNGRAAFMIERMTQG